jgi:hypothetical protein
MNPPDSSRSRTPGVASPHESASRHSLYTSEHSEVIGIITPERGGRSVLVVLGPLVFARAFDFLGVSGSGAALGSFDGSLLGDLVFLVAARVAAEGKYE